MTLFEFNYKYFIDDIFFSVTDFSVNDLFY